MSGSGRDTMGRRARGLPAWARGGAWVGVGLGIACVGWGAVAAPSAMWPGLLVSFLYWTGLAQGILVWAAVYRLVGATWGPAMARLARSTVGFTPVAVGVMILLYFGRSHWLTWAPVFEEKRAWLNETFFFTRVIGALVLMSGVSLWFSALYRRAEMDLASGSGGPAARRVQSRLTSAAVVLCIVYAVAYSVVAFDVVMSLSPKWYSTMMGPYYFVANALLALGGILVLGVWARARLPIGKHLGDDQFRDVCNLMLGFAVLTTGLLYAQVLTIWYGNMHEETEFVILRVYEPPWRALAWAVLVIAFVAPFALLQNTRLKERPYATLAPAACVLAGMFLERALLVLPSIDAHSVAPPLGFAILTSLGFAGGLALVVDGALSGVAEPSVVDLETVARAREEAAEA